MTSTSALQVDAEPTRSRPPAAEMDGAIKGLVTDLHNPRPAIFWADLLVSAGVGWIAFAVAVAAAPWSLAMLTAVLVSGFALYRGLCFTHELTHLRRRSVPGFETAWDVLFGVPLLLPSFTYVGFTRAITALPPMARRMTRSTCRLPAPVA